MDLWFQAENNCYVYASPCTDASAPGKTMVVQIEEKETLPGLAIGVIVAIHLLFGVLRCGMFVIPKNRRSGKPTFSSSKGEER